MRYYLDTNMLVFLLFEPDSISKKVASILANYENLFFTSSICVIELIHLLQIGKITKKNWAKEKDIVSELEKVGVSIEPLQNKHLQTLSKLPIENDHRDPFDRIIIAQAISDKIALVSSDRKFLSYAKNGLQFVWNER